MSEYTTRPRVRTVAASPHTSAGTGAAAVASGIVLAGAAAATLLRTAGAAWAATRDTGAASAAPGATSNVLLSPRSLREQFASEERQAAAALLADHHSAVDALRGATVRALERTPFLAEGAALTAPVTALAEAADLASAERARTALLDEIERSHLRLFVRELSEAAASASREAGFASTEIRPSPDGAAARIIATDAAGRSLVTEVAPDGSGDVGLATEVVGIADGTCHAALDRFDEALERRGVRSDRPRRVSTGGVCELAFARDFLRSRTRPPARSAATPAPASSPDAALSRRRAQNRPAHVTRRTSRS